MMFGEDEDFDNTAVDLDRIRKLSGLPNNAELGAAPATVYEPEDSYDLDDDDLDLNDEDADLDGSGNMGAPVMSAPVMAASPVDMGPEMAIADTGGSHWSMMLGDLEKQMPDIPVSDFRDVVDGLRRLANYAEDIRRTLVTENRKSFREYVRKNIEEGIAGVPPVNNTPKTAPVSTTTGSNGTNGTTGTNSTGAAASTTIGNNRNEAIKSIQARMGGDAVKAQKVFDNMQRKGLIKTNGGSVTMDTMDDDTFNNTVNDPMMDK